MSQLVFFILLLSHDFYDFIVKEINLYGIEILSIFFGYIE